VSAHARTRTCKRRRSNNIKVQLNGLYRKLKRKTTEHGADTLPVHITGKEGKI